MKNIIKLLLISAMGGAITLGTYKVFFEEEKTQTFIETAQNQAVPAKYSVTENTSFTEAAEKTVNGVVHVKTAVKTNGRASSPLEFFFGVPQQRRRDGQLRIGSGSGVILSEDGYIVTNNHVIEEAEEILITLNSGEEYEAELVGTDPTTDIALLKVDAEQKLPALTFSNSDKVQRGEWVLAVGNPFNLTSTVTAGIVSAKGRNIGIINEEFAIESFIQTDAAVNPGNSGGALVNAEGELIGINAAISASRSGTFVGYSFAIPSNIVKKVVEDLRNYGTVQRAFIGVRISNISPRVADELEIDRTDGVLVAGLTQNGAAADAGVQERDIIISVNGEKISTSAELQETIGRKRPGDQISLTVLRDGEKKKFGLTLRNQRGTTETIKKEDMKFISRLGGEFRPLNSKERAQIGIDYGVILKELTPGILAEQGVPKGYIITKINGMRISEVEDINESVENKTSDEPIVMQGILPNGRIKYYAFAG